MKVDPKDIYDYLRKVGIDQVHALGMLANIQGESNFESGAQEKHPIAGRGGWGLFQHTGPRRRALEAYCKAHNKSLDDWQARGSPRADARLREHTRRLMEGLEPPEDHAELMARGRAFMAPGFPSL